MKVKNVLKGLLKEYQIEEINIITDTEVLFSGAIDRWDATIDPYLLEEKRKILNSEVKKRMIFNGRKAFIFI